jgi:Tfp pilus assembly protein PilF
MSLSPPARRRALALLLALLLAALTLGTLWPVTANGFVEFDDLAYVNGNPHVTGGLTRANVVWALGTTEMGNWHPLTWLSLMLDAQLWHVNPRDVDAKGFHVTNLLLHLANVLILFAAMVRLTAAPWRSALVAALFAVHPLNVEAVAWVAERKGLLAAFFGLLTVAAYARWARGGGRLTYAAVVLFFALSLMSKAVTVTLPAALVLLDFWPLRRAPLAPAPLSGDAPAAAPASWRRLLGEKVPLFALALGFSALAPLAQQDAGALRSVSERPLPGRLADTLVNPLSYLRKLAWPSDLAVFYPHESRPLLSPLVLGSAAVMVAVTALALWGWRRRPYLPVGWLWYLGMLLPVAGLVPVGGHSLADRYVYLPMIGIFLLLVWGAAALLAAARLRTLALPLGAAVVAGCVVVTVAQLPHWHDPVTLWEQALRVTDGNHRAYHNLGAHYLNSGQIDRAADNLAEAVRLRPDKADWRLHLGRALVRQGKWDEARIQFAEALRLDPTMPAAANDLGEALEQLGDPSGAAEQYRKAVELEPASLIYRCNLAYALHEAGKTALARAAYDETLRTDPSWPDALSKGVRTWALTGQPPALDPSQAIRQARMASQARREASPDALDALAATYARAGRFDEAVVTARKAHELAVRGRQDELAKTVEGRLHLYEAHHPAGKAP